MKGLILSGGKGTRLRPLTYTGAKQLIPVANRPILFYVLDNLVHAGINEIGIIISPETGEEIKKAVQTHYWPKQEKRGKRQTGSDPTGGTRPRPGLTPKPQITYILQEHPAGLAHAVKVARDFLEMDAFVMYLGDNLVGARIKGLIERFLRSEADALILLKEVENPSQFGVAQTDKKGKVIRLVEKPKRPPSNLALVGVYVFSPSIHEAIDKITPSWRGELEITDAIQRLIETRKSVTSYILEEWWLDTGKKDDILTANSMVLDEWIKPNIQGKVDRLSKITGRVVLGKGTEVIRSTIRGPVVIGDGCQIEDSFIGPFTSIGNKATVSHSVIENSVLLEGARVSLIDRLEDSLIGRNAKVERHNRHRAFRLAIGDDSTVEI